MAESFMGAYRLAQLQAGTQIQTARMQQETAAAEAQAKQFQEMAKNAQSNIDAALKTVSTMAQSHLDKGGDIADPQFQAAAGVIVDSALQTSAQYASRGLPVVTPDILAQQFQNVFSAPSRVQAAEAEGRAEAAKTSVTEPAKIKAKNENELVDAFDVSGPEVKKIQATRAQMEASKGKIISVQQQAPSMNWQPKTFMDMKTGETRQGRFDPASGINTDMEGNQLGSNWASFTLGGTRDEMGLTTASQTDLQGQIFGLDRVIYSTELALKQLDEMRLKGVNPMSLGSKAKDAVTDAVEYAGGELSDAQVKEKTQRTQFIQNAISGLNQGIFELTGKAGTLQEFERLKAEFPDPNEKSVTKFIAKAQQSLRKQKLMRARAVYMLKEGIPFDWEKAASDPNMVAPVDLDQMEAVMKTRAEALRQEAKKTMPDASAAEIEQAVARQLVKDFGG